MVTKRDNSKSDVSPSCGPFPHQRIVTVSFSPSFVGFSKNWFVVSTNFWVDDDVVVVATESDAAASWIADVSTVQQLEKNLSLHWTTTRCSSTSMVKFQEKGQLISLNTRWEEIGAQLSARRRHPRGFVRQGRVERWRRHAPRDR